MADNYLERKMEEYRAGINKRTGHRSLSTKNKNGYLNIKYPPRRVFVTGGASGIGRTIVETFRNAGCRVAFCDIDRRKGQITAQATGSQFHPLDVTNADALIKAMEHVITHWGDIDIIINNVGISEFQPLYEATVEDFDRIIATNLRPIFITARQLLIHRRTMAEANPFGGRIINISSTRAIMSEPDTEVYSASKGGIISLTHALMASLSTFRITVNSISPGWIFTDPNQIISQDNHAQHPSQRAGMPADVARICLFLAAEESAFINGENITVDGGMTRKMIYID